MTVPSLSTIRGLLIDLDGVVYTGRLPIPGAAEFLAEARQRRLPFLLVTNNSTTSPTAVAERLVGMGIPAESYDVLTSAEAAAAYLKSEDKATGPVLVVGEDGLREEVVKQGLALANDGEAPAWVLVGLDRTFDYHKLTAATAAIRAGARFVATNVDASLPVEGGALLPGAGSIVAAIRTASGKEPVVLGKPEPGLFHRGLERLGNLAPDQVAMIGDRLDTDIDGGLRAGLRTILVLTGVSKQDEVDRGPVRPDGVVPSLGTVGALLGW